MKELVAILQGIGNGKMALSPELHSSSAHRNMSLINVLRPDSIVGFQANLTTPTVQILRCASNIMRVGLSGMIARAVAVAKSHSLSNLSQAIGGEVFA
jgi:hypothetical protein